MPFPDLPRDAIVYRGAIYKEWIRKDKSIQWQAFKLKPFDQDKNIVSHSMVPDRFEGLSNPVEGVITVRVGPVRDLSTAERPLDIIQDEEFHASLTGMVCPKDFEEGPDRDRIAEEMVNLCMEIAEKAASVYARDNV